MTRFVIESLVEVAVYAAILVGIVWWATRKEPMARRIKRRSSGEPPT